MQLTHEKKIDTILKYQKKKKELAIKYIGIDLIPNEVLLKKKDLNEQTIEQIESVFIPSGYLTGSNCLHCAVYSECEDCPYHTVLGKKCAYKDSLFRRARTKTLENAKFHNELLRLGKKLYYDLELRSGLEFEQYKEIKESV